MKLVETFTYLADELFTITFDHSAFDNLAESTFSDMVRLKPDAKTASFLNDYGAGYTFSGNSFVCFIHSRMLAAPAPLPRGAVVVPGPNTRFRFFLMAGGSFTNVTVIEPVAAGRFYYFSNRTNAGTGMFISRNAAEVNNSDLHNVPDVDGRESPLAVIDIFSSGAMNAGYELFTGASGELRRPTYRVLFRSRV
jgi:hypothetical protein